MNTGVLSWWIKPPECEFNKLPPFRTAVDIQWSHTSTLPIRLHTVNRAKRTFTFYCVPIYMHLYLQPVYDRNVPCTVQQIAFLITLQNITWVFITFLGLYMPNRSTQLQIHSEFYCLGEGLSFHIYLSETHTITPQSVRPFTSGTEYKYLLKQVCMLYFPFRISSARNAFWSMRSVKVWNNVIRI